VVADRDPLVECREDPEAELAGEAGLGWPRRMPANGLRESMSEFVSLAYPVDSEL